MSRELALSLSPTSAEESSYHVLSPEHDPATLAKPSSNELAISLPVGDLSPVTRQGSNANAGPVGVSTSIVDEEIYSNPASSLPSPNSSRPATAMGLSASKGSWNSTSSYRSNSINPLVLSAVVHSGTTTCAGLPPKAADRIGHLPSSQERPADTPTDELLAAPVTHLHQHSLPEQTQLPPQPHAQRPSDTAPSIDTRAGASQATPHPGPHEQQQHHHQSPASPPIQAPNQMGPEVVVLTYTDVLGVRRSPSRRCPSVVLDAAGRRLLASREALGSAPGPVSDLVVTGARSPGMQGSSPARHGSPPVKPRQSRLAQGLLQATADVERGRTSTAGFPGSGELRDALTPGSRHMRTRSPTPAFALVPALSVGQVASAGTAVGASGGGDCSTGSPSPSSSGPKLAPFPATVVSLAALFNSHTGALQQPQPQPLRQQRPPSTVAGSNAAWGPPCGRQQTVTPAVRRTSPGSVGLSPEPSGQVGGATGGSGSVVDGGGGGGGGDGSSAPGRLSTISPVLEVDRSSSLHLGLTHVMHTHHMRATAAQAAAHASAAASATDSSRSGGWLVHPVHTPTHPSPPAPATPQSQPQLHLPQQGQQRQPPPSSSAARSTPVLSLPSMPHFTPLHSNALPPHSPHTPHTPPWTHSTRSPALSLHVHPAADAGRPATSAPRSPPRSPLRSPPLSPPRSPCSTQTRFPTRSPPFHSVEQQMPPSVPTPIPSGSPSLTSLNMNDLNMLLLLPPDPHSPHRLVSQSLRRKSLRDTRVGLLEEGGELRRELCDMRMQLPGPEDSVSTVTVIGKEMSATGSGDVYPVSNAAGGARRPVPYSAADTPLLTAPVHASRTGRGGGIRGNTSRGRGQEGGNAQDKDYAYVREALSAGSGFAKENDKQQMPQGEVRDRYGFRVLSSTGPFSLRRTAYNDWVKGTPLVEQLEAASVGGVVANGLEGRSLLKRNLQGRSPPVYFKPAYQKPLRGGDVLYVL